jgi:alkylhydroperoxidase family enzyme
MLLRASGERDNTTYDLHAVTSDDLDSGVAHSQWLRTLTEQAITGDWGNLAVSLATASSAMGEQQAVDALTVAAAFNGITRVADATGIPLDDNTAAVTADLRAATRIDEFDYAVKSGRYG